MMRRRIGMMIRAKVKMSDDSISQVCIFPDTI
jgi:hypothetical protein